MSPTQAREIIEAAGERIAEWEDRLRITNGDGVEVWNSSGGQMVAVAPAGRAPQPPEPLEILPILWAEIGLAGSVSSLFGIDSEGQSYKISDGYTFQRFSGNVPLAIMTFLPPLAYGGQGDSATLSREAFNNPDRLVSNDVYTYAVAIPIAPFGDLASRYNNPQPPYERITEGAKSEGSSYDDETRDGVGQRTTRVGVRMAIRGYTSDYFYDRMQRRLPLEFGKGQNIGSYDLIIRQDDRVFDGLGTPDENGNQAVFSRISPNSRRVRVGFSPTVAAFSSTTPSEPISVISPGDIGVVAYRKV